jgi:hypothetical protein
MQAMGHPWVLTDLSKIFREKISMPLQAGMGPGFKKTLAKCPDVIYKH